LCSIPKIFTPAQLRTFLAAVAFGNQRGEAFYQLDARFSKDFKFGERPFWQ
jgi:hypothetical protein